jgi:hypothetical protein
MLPDFARTENHRLRRIEPVAQATCERAAPVRAPEVAGRSANGSLEPVVGHPRRTLAGRRGPVSTADIPGGAGVPHRRPDSAVGRAARRRPDASVLPSTQLPRWQVPGGVSRTPAQLPGHGRPDRTPRCWETIGRGSIARIRLLNTEVAHLEHGLADALDSHPKTPLLRSLPRVPTSALPRSSQRSVLRSNAARTRNRSQQCVAQHRSPRPPASPEPSVSATPPTGQHASPSPASPTTPDTPQSGLATATGEHAHAAPDTHTPSGSSPADGCKSSGPAGPGRLSTTLPTPRRATAGRRDLTKRAQTPPIRHRLPHPARGPGPALDRRRGRRAGGVMGGGGRLKTARLTAPGQAARSTSQPTAGSSLRRSATPTTTDITPQEARPAEDGWT